MKICSGGERDFQHLFHPNGQISALCDHAGSKLSLSVIVSSPSYSLNLLHRGIAVDVII